MTSRHPFRWVFWAGLAFLGVLTVGVLSVSIWLRPVIEHVASARFGRPITIGALRLRPGDPVSFVFDNLVINNPRAFPAAAAPFARISHVTVGLNAFATLRRRQLVMNFIDLEQPVLRAVSTPQGQKNFVFPSTQADIGKFQITDGQAHVTLAGLRADFEVTFGTQAASSPGGATQLVATSHGPFAALPSTAQLTGGAAIHSGKSAQPWPFALRITNGDTRITVDGTLREPMSPSAAQLKLHISGPSMALLKPLIGISFPPTPTYSFDGELNYADDLFQIKSDTGLIGQSDFEGTLVVRTSQGHQPDIIANLRSSKLTMQDVASVMRGPSPEKQQAKPAAATARRGSDVFSQKPLHLSELSSATLHLAYAAQVVQGTSTSLNNLDLHAQMGSGALSIQPFSVGIGQGKASGALSLAVQTGGMVRVEAEIRLDRADVGHLLQAKGEQGQLALNGTLHLRGAGGSVAAILGAADGGAALWMQGGELSALLVDLAGLRLDSALLSWLSGPRTTQVQCFVADLPMRHGIILTRALTLETTNAVMEGHGEVNLGQKTIDLLLQSHSKHFTIGVLPGPLRISGALADPSIAPATRGGLASVLSLLPSVQFGVEDTNQCEVIMADLRGGHVSP